MRNLFLFFLVGACSADPYYDGLVIDPEPFTEKQVMQIVDHVADSLHDKYPHFKSDMEDYGVYIRFESDFSKMPCKGRTGCAWMTGEIVVWATAEHRCPAQTSLTHELLHVLTYVYGLGYDHSEPGLWHNDSWDGIEDQIEMTLPHDTNGCW